MSLSNTRHIEVDLNLIKQMILVEKKDLRFQYKIVWSTKIINSKNHCWHTFFDKNQQLSAEAYCSNSLCKRKFEIVLNVLLFFRQPNPAQFNSSLICVSVTPAIEYGWNISHVIFDFVFWFCFGIPNNISAIS